MINLIVQNTDIKMTKLTNKYYVQKAFADIKLMVVYKNITHIIIILDILQQYKTNI